MRTTRAAVAAGALWLLFCSGAWVARGDDREHERREPLAFTVTPSARAYERSERITLTLALGLDRRARAGATVTTYGPGSIRVVSARRDGKAITPLEGTANFEVDPFLLQTTFLTTIGPGERVTIPFAVPQVPGAGSVLIVERLDPDGAHTSRIYPLEKPGLYTFRFLYRYTGPDDGRPNVFRGEVLSNTVRFRLR